MKTKRIHFPIVACKHVSGKIPVPEYLPKLHGLQAWIGRRSSGKTTACVSLLQRYMAIGAIERVILISPTYESNRHAFAPLKIKDSDVIEPTTNAIDEVIALLDEEMNEWLDYHRRKKEYAHFRKEMHRNTFTDANLMMWDQMGFLDAMTEPKWKNADDSRPSRIYVLMDDIMGTNMLKMGKGQEKFVNLCIKHRHMLCHNGTAYGISIGCLLQSYSSHATLPRSIRENLTLLCLFLNSDTNQRKKVKEELCDIKNIDQLEEFWDYACARPFGFLCVDMDAKPEHRFRACYDEYLS